MNAFSLKAIANWMVGSLALALAHVILAKASYLSVISPFNVSLLWLPAVLGTRHAVHLEVSDYQRGHPGTRYLQRLLTGKGKAQRAAAL